jgi:phenylpyruvate tautomerase PptA (4-oxalocrotonate tautomerase family)
VAAINPLRRARMPYYQLLMPEGVLTSSSRSTIAKEITHIHCEETGAPESFVQEIKKGTQYTAGEIDDQVGVFLGMIREGRSIKERQRIIQRMSKSISGVLGRPEKELILNISEINSATAMEFGLILPHPGGEPEWFEKNKEALKGVSGTGL